VTERVKTAGRVRPDDSGWSEPNITKASRRARLSMTRKPGRLGGWEGIPRNTTTLPISTCIMCGGDSRRQSRDRLPFRVGPSPNYTLDLPDS
jgi:hypothetical protein